MSIPSQTPSKLNSVEAVLADRAVADLPKISTKFLKETGLLVQSADGVRGTSATIDAILPKPLQILRNSAFTIELIWPYGRGKRRQLVGLDWREMTWGVATLFICPVTFERCRALYFKDGRFASRAGHRIRYASQQMDTDARLVVKQAKFVEKLDGSGRRGPARGRNRKRLIKEMWDQNRFGPLGGGLVTASVAKEARRLERSRDIAAAVVSEPMRRAMKSGRESFKWLTSDAISQDVTQALKRGETDRVHHPLAIRASQLDYAMIDMRSLRPRARVARSHALRWLSTEVVESAQIFVSLVGDDSDPELWISGAIGFEASPIRQIIKLEYGDVRRSLYMICPVLGTRCLKLYLRHGFFASSEAHRLANLGLDSDPKPPTFRGSLADWREPGGIPRRRAKDFGD